MKKDRPKINWQSIQKTCGEINWIDSFIKSKELIHDVVKLINIFTYRTQLYKNIKMADRPLVLTVANLVH